jgi:hypothetical protein
MVLMRWAGEGNATVPSLVTNCARSCSAAASSFAKICLTHPGFEIDVLVTADLSVYFEIWLGRRRLEEALHVGQVAIDAIPSLANAFPNWFSYSLAAPAVRAAQGR